MSRSRSIWPPGSRPGNWEPGRRLPPERELAAEYGVAYHTVRSAMRLLREAGLIVTMHGRGTFVARREEAPPPGTGNGASEEEADR